MSKGKPKPIERRADPHGQAHVVVRLLVMWIVNALGLWVGAAFVPGVTLDSFGWALVAAALLGALNALHLAGADPLRAARSRPGRSASALSS